VHPQRFGVPPPPHVSGIVHEPQSIIARHPSDADPQF
jgi:hypothetical protein